MQLIKTKDTPSTSERIIPTKSIVVGFVGIFGDVGYSLGDKNLR